MCYCIFMVCRDGNKTGVWEGMVMTNSIQCVTEEMTTGHTANEYWSALNVIATIVSEKELSIIRGRCLAATMFCHARELSAIEHILATQNGIRSVKFFGKEIRGTKKTVAVRAIKQNRINAMLADL